MNLHDREPDERKTERLQLLKARAQAVLDQYNFVDTTNRPAALEVTKLLEDLRIYQVELELQNDELRAAQMSAELAQRSYRTLFDQMPLAALVLDNQGMVDEANDIANVLLDTGGRSSRLDLRFWRRLNKTDRTRLHVSLRDVLPGQTQVLERLELITENAPTQVFDAHLIGLSMDYKLDRRVLILLVDRSVEQAREQEQRLYNALLDATDQVVFAADSHGRMLLANQAMLESVRSPRDRVLGQPRETFMNLRDAVMHNEADQRVMQSRQPTTVEQQVQNGPGRPAVDWLTHRFPLLDAAGCVYGVGGIATDVTALKIHQRQILLSESVFMCSDESIIITDAMANIIRVNPAFTRMTGFSPESVLGENTRILKSGRHSASFYEGIWESLTRHGHWAGEINNRRADGSFFTVWSSINVVCDEQGRVLHYIGLQSDVTQLHEAQLALQYQASYDSLTGLPNRHLFNDRLAQLIAHSLRQQSNFSLLFIDLDHFKEVNDTLGHQAGDHLLRTVAERLLQGVRNEDTVARLGGDEFVVLLPGTDQRGASALSHMLLKRLRESVPLTDGSAYRPMASIGAAVFPEDGKVPDALLRSADLAMYRAKLTGRNRMLSFAPDMDNNTEWAFTIQAELSCGLAQQHFRLYFQPKCRLDNGQLVGAEALVRWERPGHGLTSPSVFLDVAQKSGLLGELDHWVMQAALRQVGQWRQAGLWAAPMRLSINQNEANLQKPGLLEQIGDLLRQHDASADLLEIEIMEDAVLDPTPQQLARLRALRDLGISLAVDDFGTGHTSLSCLRSLPVSVIKLDRSVVASVLTDDSHAALVRTMVDTAHAMGCGLVAEGVETSQQRERLASLGAEVAQGYLFGYPVRADEFETRWLRVASIP